MFQFTASIRIRNNGTAPASRYFVSIPKDIADDIKKTTAWFISQGRQARRWRWSVKVEAMIGYLKRKTSIFPDKKSNSFLLPIKADIRKELRIKDGDTLAVQIEIL